MGVQCGARPVARGRKLGIKQGSCLRQDTRASVARRMGTESNSQAILRLECYRNAPEIVASWMNWRRRGRESGCSIRNMDVVQQQERRESSFLCAGLSSCVYEVEWHPMWTGEVTLCLQLLLGGSSGGCQIVTAPAWREDWRLSIIANEISCSITAMPISTLARRWSSFDFGAPKSW